MLTPCMFTSPSAEIRDVCSFRETISTFLPCSLLPVANTQRFNVQGIVISKFTGHKNNLVHTHISCVARNTFVVVTDQA